MIVETIKGKSEDIIVIDIGNCVVAKVTARLNRNTKYSEKEAECLQNRFLMWASARTFDSSIWTKASRNFGDYRISAFVKGKDVDR